jgi:hypothetical protein
MDNQLRGILKTFGLVIGKCGHGQIGERAQELAEVFHWTQTTQRRRRRVQPSSDANSRHWLKPK